MKWARVESGVVAEVILDNPHGKFHESLVWVPCSDAVSVGWSYSSGDFSPPAEASIQSKMDEVWSAIKAERLRRALESGYKVEVSTGVFKWFHSDTFTRIQMGRIMGRNDSNKNIPTTPWKTMDGSFVTLTKAIVDKLDAAAEALDSAVFIAAEQHKAAAWALADPLSYTGHLSDAGWPEYYQPV